LKARTQYQMKRDKLQSSHDDIANGTGEGNKAADPIFGISLDEAVLKSSQIVSNVPDVVAMCIVYIREKAVEEEGIFRISGSQTKIKELRETIDEGLSVNLNEVNDVHVISGLLKLYFRELPQSFLSAEIVITDDANETLAACSAFVNSLSAATYTTAKMLYELLNVISCHSDVNKMPSKNLSIVFAPTLGCPNEVLAFLIDNYADAFQSNLIEL